MTTSIIYLSGKYIGSFLSLSAAFYWLKSTQTKLPAIDPTTGKPNNGFNVTELHKTLLESAKSNKIAAILTGVSVVILSLTDLLSN